MGTGDGSFAYALAQANPDILVIGVDSNAENLRPLSHKAQRKASKGGLANVLFGQLALEAAPGDLEDLADSLSIILPWGSLLKGVALPVEDSLLKLHALLKPKGKVEIVFGYNRETDPGLVRELALPEITIDRIDRELALAYRSCGFHIRAASFPSEELRRIPSVWAKKLSFAGKNRGYVRILGSKLP